MIRRPPRSTQSRSSAASDVYKRQVLLRPHELHRLGRGGPRESHEGSRRQQDPSGEPQTRLIVQPKAFVSAAGTGLLERTASSAFLRSGDFTPCGSSWFS